MTSSGPQQPPRRPPTAVASGSASGDSWNDNITPAREQELLNRLRDYFEATAQNPTADGAGPFAGVRLTGADVRWLAEYTLFAIDEGRPPGDPHLLMLTAHFTTSMIATRQRIAMAMNDPLLRASLKFATLDLRNAILSAAQLDKAVLGGVLLTGAGLGVASLRDAYLGGAQMADSFMDHANLQGAILREANLTRTSLRQADLRFADLGGATLDDAIMRNAKTQEARLIGASVRRVDLRASLLQNANFIQADLTDAYLYEAHLEGALFTDATLTGCDLRRASLSGETRLNKAHLNLASLEQLRLGDANLAVVDWSEVKKLGDQKEAREWQKRDYRYRVPRDTRVQRIAQWWKPRVGTSVKEPPTPEIQRQRLRGRFKTWPERADDYRAAARAYRALSVALDDQGLAREAARFQYHAEVMGRKAAFFRGEALQWFVSLLLGWFAGYGVFQIWRLFISYAVIIIAFASFYWTRLGYLANPLAIFNAATRIDLASVLLLSVTIFHGRGFSGQSLASGDVLLAVAATIEAVLGVVVEALLVAALVRRITGH